MPPTARSPKHASFISARIPPPAPSRPIPPAYGSGISAPPAGITFDPREATVNRNVWRYGDADIVEQTYFFNAAVPLRPAGALELYAFGGYGLSEASSNASFRRPADNTTVRALFPNGFLPYVDTDRTNASLGAGLRGKATEWDWDLSQEFDGNRLKYYVRNTVNATLGAASTTRFYNGTLKSSQAVTNLDLKRSVDVGLAALVKIATGAEFRFDAYRIRAGEPASYTSGGVRILDAPPLALSSPSALKATAASARVTNKMSIAPATLSTSTRRTISPRGCAFPLPRVSKTTAISAPRLTARVPSVSPSVAALPRAPRSALVSTHRRSSSNITVPRHAHRSQHQHLRPHPPLSCRRSRRTRTWRQPSQS